MKLKNVLIISISSLVLAFAILSQMISSWLLQDELKYNLNRQLDLAVSFIQQRTLIVIRGVAVDFQILESNAAFLDLLNYRKYSLSEEGQLKKIEIESLFKKVVLLRPSYIKVDLIDARDDQVVVQVFSPQRKSKNQVTNKLVYPNVTYRNFNNNVEVSDPLYDPDSNDYILKVKNNLIHNSIKVGEIVADISLSRLLNELNRLQFLSESKVIIKDSFGQVINKEITPESESGMLDPSRPFQSKSLTLPNMNWTMRIAAASNEIDTLQKTFSRRVLPVLVLMLAFVLIIILFISKMVSKPAEDIVSLLKSNQELDDNRNYLFQLKLKNSSYEFRDIATSLDEMFVRLRLYYKKSVQLKSFQSKVILAQQVAHDIRSPLAALNMLTGELSSIPETDRALMKGAIHRINDIVNDLLRQYKKEERSLSGEQEQQKFTPISQVIDSILTEKRTQFRSKIGVNIESSAGDGAYGLFTRASEKELKRVISNLINNSVEAFEDHGQIRVEYGAKGNEIVITIDDNGKGIPKDLLAKLGQRGETYGKVDGLGLGLYHAKTCIDSWGGEFTIQSEVGLGTRVSIKIPKSKEPSWFLPAISLKEISTLVILDDDVSIHQIWEKRLKELNLLQGQGLTLEQFSRPQELVSWYKSDSNPGKLLFLIDQQFLANEMSGLNVIEQLEIQSKSILVTSHFDEQEIISKCERLGVKIIPKGLASVVPILSEPTH